MFERSYILLTGEDRFDFLNGLMTNDVRKVSSENTIFTAFLNAQGRFLFDAFISEKEDRIVIDSYFQTRDALFSHLSKYKLRAKINLEKIDVSPFLFSWPDPFSKNMTHQERIMKTIPFGVIDVIPEKGFILECGYDELGAIDWQKGCYLGQELIAKTKYRGEIRKKLMTIIFDDIPDEAIMVMTKNGMEAGEIRSREKGCAIAMMRLEFIQDQEFFVKGSPITLYSPQKSGSGA
jgi:folate-binding protein YgfZ